ncbi:MAG: alpha/beta fold hydrolase [Thiohalomonas sp.]|nr:alpha/beta fold hydrolase [Thiohalomonas sp.]
MNISEQCWGNHQASEQILFIHGWGMNSGVWTGIAEYLAQNYPDKLIRSVDLPGYGHSADYSIAELGGQYNSQTLAKSLEPLIQDKQSRVIAWSMGGLVAIELLSRLLRKKRQNIAQLILVSSTPHFVQADDWQYAVQAKVFEEFSQSLNKDHHATLKRFLAIQALGSRTAREDIKTLQKQLFLRGEPSSEALSYGLQILLTEDKRQQLKQLTDCPITLISGTKDRLIAHQGQKQLAEQENISLFSIPFASHAPFISHPEEFKQILQNVI